MTVRYDNFTIVKSFSFSAAHHLLGLPVEHQCGRDHGHNYEVEIELHSNKLDAVGMVVDYGKLEEFRTYLDAVAEHRDLNRFMEQPTAENLAKTFFEWAVVRWPQLAAVRVRETPKTCAEYRRS